MSGSMEEARLGRSISEERGGGGNGLGPTECTANAVVASGLRLRFQFATLRWHSPERNCGDQIFMTRVEVWAKNWAKNWQNFRASFAVQKHPTKISPQTPPNLSLHVLSRLLWMKSQNFISASFWGGGGPKKWEQSLALVSSNKSATTRQNTLWFFVAIGAASDCNGFLVMKSRETCSFCDETLRWRVRDWKMLAIAIAIACWLSPDHPKFLRLPQKCLI